MGFVEIAVDGVNYQAEYCLDENVVVVFGRDGQEATQLGGMSELKVAKMLLRNLVRKGLIDPVEGQGD